MSFRNLMRALSMGALISLTALHANAQIFGPGIVQLPGYPPSYYGSGGYTGPPLALGPNGFAPTNYGYYGPSWYGPDYYRGTPDMPAAGNTAGTGFQNASRGNTGSFPIPRTTDTIRVSRETGGAVRMEWQGDTRGVSQIYFALLDRSGKVLRRQTIAAPPASVRFVQPRMATSYQIVVTYINGTTSSVTGPV